MRVILCTLLFVMQVSFLSAHERFGFKIKQEKQERIVKEAYADGYKKYFYISKLKFTFAFQKLYLKNKLTTFKLK
jgi:hypothetical protein